MLENTRRKVKLLLPYSDGALASKIRKEGAVLNEEFRENGLFMEAVLDGIFLNNVRDYILPDEE